MTQDHLLGGRVSLTQQAEGYRAAIDPVLLAAATAARPDEQILDAGCGSGAASLCLAVRTPSCRIVGIELDPEAAGLARLNAAANRLADRITVADGSFADYAAQEAGRFDQVMTNPPFHEQGRHTKSPEAGKAAAHGEGDIDLEGWIEAAQMALKRGGRLTLIHRTDRIAAILGAFTGRFGAAIIVPLWPRADAEAKRILVSAVKGRKTLPRLHPGLVLHETDGRYTPAADAILRDAEAFDFGQASL